MVLGKAAVMNPCGLGIMVLGEELVVPKGSVGAMPPTCHAAALGQFGVMIP